MSLGFNSLRERRDHGRIQLQQLQHGLTSGAFSQRDYEKSAARIRRKYGLQGWPVHTNESG